MTLTYMQGRTKIFLIAALLILVLISGLGFYSLYAPSPDTDSTNIEGFDIMASISGTSFDTSSGSVSEVGVNITSAVLDTTNQVGDETVNYSITIQQDDAGLVSGGGSVPSNFGSSSVTVNGSSQASNTGDESYGSKVESALNVSLGGTESSTLATDVGVNSGQTIDFNYTVTANAEIRDASNNLLDSTSSGTSNPTLVVSDITATIDSFSLSGSLSAQESETLSGSLNINPPVPGQEIISKTSGGKVIDTAVTDSEGNFTIDSAVSGTIVANVEGFENYSSLSNINNNLYASKQVSVSSIKKTGEINLSNGSSTVVTLSNSSGSKVDVLYNTDSTGTLSVSNPWQVKGMSNLPNQNGQMVKDIELDKPEFVTFNDGNKLNSYENVKTSGNKVSGLLNLSVTWIDVGQADAILLTSEGGDNMLIDSGGFLDDGETVIDYLNKEGINNIDHLVASHQDADHIGGHEKVINTFGSSGIGEVYDNGNNRSTNTAQEYLNAVPNNGLSITEVSQGDTIPFKGADVEVLNPVDNVESQSSDGDVVVLKVSHANNSIFLGGDVESDSESRIVDANSGNLDVEIMDVPHHGSSTSSTNKLLNELTPEIGVVSAPFDSQFGHPDDVVIDRYESRGIDLFWTAANGNVTITSSTKGIQTSIGRGSLNDVKKDPNYQISVQNIATSVDQGSTVTPNISISNNGNVTDIQDITMTVSGQGDPVDVEENVKLAESQSTSFSLSWDTTGFVSQNYTLSISTEDDSISRTVSVNGSGGSGVNVSDSIQNPSFESEGGWDFSDTDVQRSTSSDPAFDGDFSAIMKDLTQGYDGRILESNRINVTGNEYYKAGIYYNIQSPSRDSNLDEYSVKIVWFDESGNEISRNGIFGAFSNTGGTWEEVRFSEQAPSGAESAILRIRAKEGGTNNPTVYWDLASLDKFTNQLSNPSFESTGSWDFTDTDVQRSSSSDPSFDGDFSASMKDLTQGYNGRILESSQIPVDGGEEYQFGSYYNVQSPSRDGNLDEYSISVVWLDSSGSEIAVTDEFGDFPSTTGVWTKDSALAQAPQNAASAKLRIRAKEGGTNDPTVYWDSAFIKG